MRTSPCVCVHTPLVPPGQCAKAQVRGTAVEQGTHSRKRSGDVRVAYLFSQARAVGSRACSMGPNLPVGLSAQFSTPAFTRMWFSKIGLVYSISRLELRHEMRTLRT